MSKIVVIEIHVWQNTLQIFLSSLILSPATIFLHRLYFERIGQVEERLEEVKKGGAAEFLVPLAELEKSIRMRAHVAGVLRELRLNNINNKHESESKGAQENHEVCLLNWDLNQQPSTYEQALFISTKNKQVLFICKAPVSLQVFASMQMHRSYNCEKKLHPE